MEKFLAKLVALLLCLTLFLLGLLGSLLYAEPIAFDPAALNQPGLRTLAGQKAQAVFLQEGRGNSRFIHLGGEVV